MSLHPGQNVHLELKGTTFVLYTEHSRQRFEVPYSAADEVIEQLTRVIGSEGWLRATPPQPEPQVRPGTGHLPPETRKLRKSSTRRKMRPICQACGNTITHNSKILDLARREFGKQLCPDCYRIQRNAPRGQ